MASDRLAIDDLGEEPESTIPHFY
ncbi:hypothetical protein CCACVL1_00600 [Corchorus capsularis]|uniref:Uncharacterized protein n=1 Tax=Corchorus capsularis TaxID=210143 RepID=A0A1R3KVZ5_COCAP|nr:hypothetical protein CCACVL1_00600 [Corchorus capsularis]